MVVRSGDATDEYTPLTRSMISRVDPRLDRLHGLAPSVDELVDTFRANKLSLEYLDDESVESTEVDAQREHRELREERLRAVTARLNDGGVQYASMKNLRTPAAIMSDIDLLVPDPSEQAQSVRILSEDGYEFYRFRLLAHPRKIMAKTAERDPRPVDIYPDAIWIRKLVCDAERVVSRADRDGTRTPAPEDDMYLVATHAFSHMSVTFAELYHGVRVLEDAREFDWDALLGCAVEYGCADGLYVYLALLDRYLRFAGRDHIPAQAFDRLTEERGGQFARYWWRRFDGPVEFPVEIPIWLANVTSSVYHTPKVARHASLRETLKDFQSHYLAAASQYIFGEA